MLQSKSSCLLVIAGLLILVIVSSVCPLVSDSNRNQDRLYPLGLDTNQLADYGEYDPILITSDDDFETQGWPGEGTPEEPYVIEGLSISGASGAGIDISFVNVHFVIRNCLITSCQSGISTVYTSNATIVDNICNDNEVGGIYLREESKNISIINNTFNFNQMGVYFWGWYGSSTNITVFNNTCNDNDDTGIFIDRAVTVITANNTCNGNYDGIYSQEATDVILENNTTYGGQYGIKLDGSNGISVRWNIMRGSHYAAQETNGKSFFDYNYYHDYDGIDDNGDRIGDTPYNKSGVVDIHPMMYPPSYGPPTINQLNDMEIESGSIGQSILWNSSPLLPYSGLFPYTFKLYINGTLEDSGSNTTIEVSLDNLDVGVYNYTIIVTDDDGHSISDTIIVSVVDTTPPVLDSPADILYEEFNSGYSITWTPSDLNPSNYTVYLNGSFFKSGPWNSSSETVTISVDGLSQGMYNFTIVVIDVGLNWAKDTVIVTVIPDSTPPTIDNPSDVLLIEGGTDYVITWNPYDLYPVSYIITSNGIVVVSGLWNSSGESISLSLASLTAGTYNVTLIVIDIGGNTASDSVLVTILPATTIITTITPTTTTTTETTSTTTSTPPSGFGEMIMFAALGAGAIVVVMIVLVIKQKK